MVVKAINKGLHLCREKLVQEAMGALLDDAIQHSN